MPWRSGIVTSALVDEIVAILDLIRATKIRRKG